jgi:DNA-binding beta-propeller fold protein YncE
MLAVLYLAALVLAGDALGRRWLGSGSGPRRWATAFLVGLPLASWLSYLAALLFDGAGDRLLLGDLIAGWWLVLVALWAWRRGRATRTARATAGDGAAPVDGAAPAVVDRDRDRVQDRWDLLTIGAITLLVGWMMISTYHVDGGRLAIASGLWSDFGPTSAIAQSFAVGDNFPTEYPHYAGEPIRYHFLYYFQVGNLTHLGLDPATANNVLSIGSLVAMLVLVMALGRRLFGSRLVGRLGALLLFFHGALSFVPWLANLGSIERIAETLPGLAAFMDSGFPYRGEQWGIWTQMVFLNQRHLASAIGVVLVIVLFLLERLPGRQEAPSEPDVRTDALDLEPVDADATRPVTADVVSPAPRRPIAARLREAMPRPVGPRRLVLGTVRDPALPGFLLCGALAGMLPLWNGSMFVAIAALLAVWLVLFPNRPQMLVLAAASAVFAVPQLLWVRPGTMAGEQTYPSLYWGYVVNDPTVANVAAYLGFVFGPKLLLIAVALLAASWRQWRVFIAFTSLVAVAFLIQLSVEVLANHKFINAWLIVANLFAAAGLVRLWHARPRLRIPARAVAIGLAAVIVAGGVIDLLPVRNQGMQVFAMEDDPLYEWVLNETDPDAVFLTDVYVVHQILLAGRRIYFGWPYYAWSAGYDVGPRETWYRDTFAERSPRALAERLRTAAIDYVAIDDGLRAQTFAPRLNEEVFRASFEQVFRDEDGSHANLAIYRVPTDSGAIEDLPGAPEANMYDGGGGSAPGLLDEPLGLAVEHDGTLLVADSANDRLQRFSSAGNPIDVLGGPGSGPGQFDRPVGVATDRAGQIYVADAGNRRVQLLAPDGTFLREWTGSGEGFASVTDVDTENDLAYVLDAANGQVARLGLDGSLTAWGSVGGGPGQLREPTGLAVAGGTVVVADTGNARVVVFDLDGAYLREWPVPEWQGLADAAPDVASDGDGIVWASSPATNAILVYLDDGTLLGSLAPAEPDALDRPAGLALRPSGSLFVSNTGDDHISLLLQSRP